MTHTVKLNTEEVDLWWKCKMNFKYSKEVPCSTCKRANECTAFRNKFGAFPIETTRTNVPYEVTIWN